MLVCGATQGCELALGVVHTLLLVDSQDNNDLIATNSDELLDRSDTSSGKLGEQNHSIDVVVLQQLDVSSHLGDLFAPPLACALLILSALFARQTHLLDVHHDKAVNLWELLLIEATVGQRHDCGIGRVLARTILGIVLFVSRESSGRVDCSFGVLWWREWYRVALCASSSS